VLRIVAAAAGVPLLIAGVRATAAKPRAFTWRGQVLDAVSELTLWHNDAAFAQATILEGARGDRPSGADFQPLHSGQAKFRG
jgi:hypothetical protein